MPASSVAARFQRASEGGILPPIVKAMPASKQKTVFPLIHR
jgi:hypothetical protein